MSNDLPIYFKDFNDNNIQSYNNFNEFLDNYKPSTYIYSYSIWFKFILYLWENNKNPTNLYVICPTYTKEEDEKLPDFQFQITGKFKKSESRINNFEDAIKREVEEEIGLSYREDYSLPPINILCVSFNENAFFNKTRYRAGYAGMIFSCFADIKNFTPFNRNVKKDDSGDNKMKRISVILYGTQDEIIDNYINVDITRSTPDEEPDIIGAVLIPIIFLNRIIFVNYKKSLQTKLKKTTVSQFKINEEKKINNPTVTYNLNRHDNKGDNSVCRFPSRGSDNFQDLTTNIKSRIKPKINSEYELYTKILNNTVICRILNIS